MDIQRSSDCERLNADCYVDQSQPDLILIFGPLFVSSEIQGRFLVGSRGRLIAPSRRIYLLNAIIGLLTWPRHYFTSPNQGEPINRRWAIARWLPWSLKQPIKKPGSCVT